MSKSVRYLIFTFALSWTIQIIGCRDLHLESVGGLLSFSQALTWCMLVPALGAFLAGADIAGMGWKPDFRASIRPLLFAWLAPTLFQLAGAALYFLVIPGDFDLTGTYLKEVHPGRFAELQKTGFSAMDYLLKEICTSLFSYRIVISVILGLGEEIGWRGFLYPELDTYFGRTKAMLLGGVIHGAWHFPIMLLAGYEYGTDYIGAPLLGMIAFCVFTVTTGIIAFHLYEKTQSIWLPAFFHGAVNMTFNPYILTSTEYTAYSVFGPADIGLISVIPAAVFAAVILLRDRRREQQEFAAFRKVVRIDDADA